LQIEKVAKSPYQGHLFAIDTDQNLIAINMKLACQGEKPYQIMSCAKEGDRITLLSVDDQNIWLIFESG
jgi:hypothetical protein